MNIAEKIKIIMIKRNLTLKEFAEMLNSAPANLGNKIRRNNFPTNELIEMANALNCELSITFKMKDTGEII